jgi:hypothetical protein
MRDRLSPLDGEFKRIGGAHLRISDFYVPFPDDLPLGSP